MVDDEYLRIYSLIEQADALSTAGQTEKATVKYRQAYSELLALKRTYPNWNTKMVAYRINYVVSKLTPSASPPADEPKGAGASPTPGRPQTGVEIKLLEPGAEPRRTLLLQPKVGDKQPCLLTIRMEMEMKMGENQAPGMKLPPIKVSTDAEVKEITPDGSIVYDIRVSKTDIAEGAGAEMADVMKQAVSALSGVSATVRITSSGIHQGTELKGGAAADPQSKQTVQQMKELFGQLATPFPPEPIGLGGKWQVTARIASQGLSMSQTTSYELASLEGNVAKILSTVSQSAPKQKIENATVPGVKLDLIKMSGKGSGEAVVDLGRVIPGSGDFKSHSEVVMGMNMGGQQQTMTTIIDLQVQLEEPGK